MIEVDLHKINSGIDEIQLNYNLDGGTMVVNVNIEEISRKVLRYSNRAVRLRHSNRTVPYRCSISEVLLEIMWGKETKARLVGWLERKWGLCDSWWLFVLNFWLSLSYTLQQNINALSKIL